jgi:DNA topoisomerase-2
MSLETQYQKLSDLEHILEKPDTYVGSIENATESVYICKDGKFVYETIDYVPALFKMFDEGIVNCADHYIRTTLKHETDPTVDVVTAINIEIRDNKITMTNNGEGIDVVKHPTYDLWIPEMIFGHLRSSTNYNKNEQKITGGKNGFGFKLVLVWSTWGRIETVDAKRCLKYTQVFENNLSKINSPKITECKKKPYTTVEFIPDYARLGMTGLTEQMINLFQRRVYDIAGLTPKEVKVKYNDEPLTVKDFTTYVKMYTDQDVIFETHERWSYAACLNDSFDQISFVNRINTTKGGTHVNYVVNQIVKKMTEYILKKKKITVKPSIIKEQFKLYLTATIENPSFDSQTKDYLNTPSNKFGSSCTVSDKFIEKLANLGILNTSCELSEIKDKKQAQKTDGKMTQTIRGILKLSDANYAGTKRSKECRLILCEGDSAKTGVMSGLTGESRNNTGVYALKGKPFNVRGEKITRIHDNKEIAEIKKILGLETGKTYTSLDGLRYGKILIMTDQDLDGSHIKGLLLNMFGYLWPSLLTFDKFIGFMNTPILKATKGKEVVSFYNENEYEEWKKTHENWKIKYYKGLGTSTGKEFKEYFENEKIVSITVDEQDTRDLDMLFNKKGAESRKQWLSDYDQTNYVDTSLASISLGEFIHKEMKHFSKKDCDRSIPKLMDGFKVSQRKITYAAFKRKLTEEVKVAQFTGYVSEHSGYHHGEMSLNGAIVNMAQDFVGSNNINLFLPIGQFGTRLQGGKDSASVRYIFTKLNLLTRMIFQKADDHILTYLDDDGMSVEPAFYLPIIPMILVNGTEGIGTGFSSKIPCFNPIDIIKYIRNKLTGAEVDLEFIPYYRGFKGKIERDENPTRFITRGVYTHKKNKVVITELPIDVWNEDYITYLEKLIDDGKIKDFKDTSTDKQVNIEVTIVDDDIEKTLKLTSYLSINNMNLFNHDEKLTHYNEVHEICDDFIKNRIKYYDVRKQYLIKQFEGEIELAKNKYTYIMEVLNDTIDLRRKKSNEIVELLKAKSYTLIENSYHYLIKMSMDSVSEENVKTLKKEYDTKQKELDKLHKTTIEEMWLSELKTLEETLKLY